jgi:hypothetical protein
MEISALKEAELINQTGVYDISIPIEKVICPVAKC